MNVINSSQAALFAGLSLGLGSLTFEASAQTAPPSEVLKIYDIATAPSADRIRDDIQTLVDFGTRHTLSESAVSDVYQNPQKS